MVMTLEKQAINRLNDFDAQITECRDGLPKP
jgi:hypothetical protein